MDLEFFSQCRRFRYVRFSFVSRVLDKAFFASCFLDTLSQTARDTGDKGFHVRHKGQLTTTKRGVW